MFSPRVIAVIVVKDGQHVQSRSFGTYLPVGSPVESAKEYDRWGIDEIVLVLLGTGGESAVECISEIAGAVAVPLTAVGGIRSLQDAKLYISNGADKIGLNRSLVEIPEVAVEAVNRFGAQSVVASMDIIREADGICRWDYWTRRSSGVPVDLWVRTVVELGVGEILVNFPERDGMCTGMDWMAVSAVCSSTDLPVVAVGGVGSAHDLVECHRSANVSGLGIGNRLAHFEHSVYLYKKALLESGANVRLATKTTYDRTAANPDGRPLKKSDDSLSELLFHRIEPETI